MNQRWHLWFPCVLLAIHRVKLFPSQKWGCGCLVFRCKPQRNILWVRKGQWHNLQTQFGQGRVLQLLILWRSGVGFCMGISLWGQQPVEKDRYMCQSGQLAESYMVSSLNRVADEVHWCHPSSSPKTMPEVPLLVTYCCITNIPKRRA